ncbi:DUF6551 family protein [Catellatospora chokoriensis]|nr:DUF6551 family protein [Catellatospora chokoriensis]
MPRVSYPYDLPAHPVDYGVEVAVDNLKIDTEAQRSLNEKRAQAMHGELVREAVGAIIVSQRANGDMYIVDGQHRWRAFQLAGISKMHAEVHHGLNQQQEATLFLIKNRESYKPNPLDQYRVGLTAGLPLYVDTEAVLKKHSLGLGSTSTNSVGAVAGVLRITEMYSAAVLDRTLWVAEWAWDRSADAWDGMLLGGIGTFLGKHGDLVDDKILATKLLKVGGTAQKWRATVLSKSSSGGFHNSGTGSRISTAYQLVRDCWNHGLKKNRIEG